MPLDVCGMNHEQSNEIVEKWVKDATAAGAPAAVVAQGESIMRDAFALARDLRASRAAIADAWRQREEDALFKLDVVKRSARIFKLAVRAMAITISDLSGEKCTLERERGHVMSFDEAAAAETGNIV